MAFRELEPSTSGALAAFANGVAGGETPTRPSKWARNSDPDHLQKLDEHEGGLRVANEKQGSARFRLNLRAEQGGMRGRVADSCTSVRMGAAASTPHWMTFELRSTDVKASSVGILDQITAGLR